MRSIVLLQERFTSTEEIPGEVRPKEEGTDDDGQDRGEGDRRGFTRGR
jgi:hypothetical protein